ncbi:MAG: hypothetical protein K2W96_07870 [Gemmataceae bacterium]|nr:hypothetical protein [Gemmataceae bacterium]
MEWTALGKKYHGKFHATLATDERYGPVLEPKQAEDVFRLLASQRDIASRYPNDGCFARAHLMVRRMQALGLAPRKVWAFSDTDLLRVVKGGVVIEWGWHVAPMVQVRTAKGVENMVIDPSIFDRPVPVREWQAARTQKGKEPPFRHGLRQAPDDAVRAGLGQGPHPAP